MDKDLQNKLFTKYPEIFQNDTTRALASPRIWGIECQNGWYELINQLCSDIMLSNPAKIPVATQVKEKYGQLCFYISGSSTDEIENLITKAERDSLTICEVCGNEGKLRMTSRGWHKTVCTKHAKELNISHVVDYEFKNR